MPDVAPNGHERTIEFLHLCDSDSVFASSPYLRITTFPQLGLLYLAAILRGKGFRVAYHDRAYERFDEAFVRGLLARKPLFIGIYENIALRADAAALVKQIRSQSPDVPIIMGGPGHFEYAEYFEAGADAVAAGQADLVIEKIAARVERGESLRGAPGLILPGMTDREAGLAPFPEDLDALPRPAWDLAPPGRFRNDLAFIQRKPWCVMLASRDCPYRCHFCSKIYPPGVGRYRLRSVGPVIEEMAALHREYGVRHVKFQDDTFGGDRSWFVEFCERLAAAALPVQWNCSSIPTLFRKDYEQLFGLMRSAGCVSLHFGLQSTSPEILKSIGRSPDEPRILAEIVPAMRKAGLYSLIDIIIGLPGETRETIAGHERYFRAVPVLMTQVFPLQIVPNTRLDEDYPDGKVTELSREEVHAGVRRLTRGFMLRPRVIWRNVAYIARHNPGYVFTFARLVPFLVRLALGKYRMAAWRSNRQTERHPATNPAGPEERQR